MLTAKIINLSNNPCPKYETDGAAGMDFRAEFDFISPQNPLVVFGSAEIIYATETSRAKVRIDPFTRVLIPTRIKVGLPQDIEMQVRPRSGMAFKSGLTVINTPGTVDEDYRGEVGIPVINLSNEPIWIQSGERVCQVVFNKVSKIKWEEVETLDETERGEGGFGHTGTN